MTDIIQLLPDHVANQIAAGEVVQRPASVVKELLENAIDAGATEIKLIVKEGGKTLIQVVDNGIGMSNTDARLSFERHATSKIKCAEDLFNLHTKGFRGEALASIAAIAHVEMQTKPEGEEFGTHLRIEGSKVAFQEVAVCPKGTSISVKNLFFNIPARRNFLKSNQVELRHISDEFHRVALVHSNISFHFYNNGSELFNLPKGNFRQRIVQIFGTKMNERLVPVEEDTEVVKLSGFVIKPEYAKKSRGEQFFFANNRFIKSPYLHHAINAAFEGLMRNEMQPGYFLQMEVDPSTIDINIHPTKTEVKFDDEQTLYAILRSAVKHSLGQFNVAPMLDFEHDRNLDTPYSYQSKDAVLPKVTVDPGFNPFEDNKSAPRQVQKQSVKGWQDLYEVDTSDSQHFSSVQFESEATNSNLFDKQATNIEESTVCFQLNHKFIVTKTKSALLVINQNRAHQRVLYEQFLKVLSNDTMVKQELLFPEEKVLVANEFGILKGIEDDLSALGFDITFDSTKKSIKIDAVPGLMTEVNIGTVLENLIVTFEEENNTNELSTTELTAKNLAKSMAVKNGQPMDAASQMALVNDLFGCLEPELSPFKKRTYVLVSDNELENKF